MAATDVSAVAQGADPVWIYCFHADGSAEPIDDGDLDRALTSHRGWIWIHLGSASARSREWVAKLAPISAEGREVLLGTDDHQRLDLIGGGIGGVLVDLQMEFMQDTDETARLRFVMTDRLFITMRRHPLRSIELTRRVVQDGQRFPAAIDLLDTFVDQFADAIGNLAQRINDQLDEVEDRILQEQMSDERQRLGQVRRQVVPLHRQLTQLKGLFRRLEPRLSGRDAVLAHAIGALAQKLDSLDHEVSAIQDRARLLHDELATKMSAITNQRLFVLSLLTAFLLPPTLVTGFFGMNTKDLPFQQVDGGTWFALLFAAGAGGLTYWILSRFRAL